jgi:hypothetical protein
MWPQAQQHQTSPSTPSGVGRASITGRATVARVAVDEDPNDWDGWTFEAPRLDPASELLTLALLEDVSALLVRHGYPPLRGYALAEVTICLQRIHTP